MKGNFNKVRKVSMKKVFMKIRTSIMLLAMLISSLLITNPATAAIVDPDSNVGGLGLDDPDLSGAGNGGSGGGNGGGGGSASSGNGGGGKNNKKSRYLPLTFVSGFNPDLELELNEKSFDLDLAKTRNLRLRLKARKLFQSIPNAASFKVEVYEEVAGQDPQFITAQTTTINRGGSNKNRILSIDAGKFLSAGKTLLFLVYDTQGNYVNTYRGAITATNISAQPSSTSNIDLPDATCGTEFGDCQLENFFRRVTFEAKKQRQSTTRVIKDENGFYTVTLPVPRDSFRAYRGSRVRTTNAGGGSGSDNGGNASNFGETIDATILRLGESALDHVAFNYDAANNQLQVGFPTGVNNGIVLDDQGRLGLGVDPVTAYLDVRGGTTTTPSVKINPGTLTTTPQNGAMEFDGTQLYFTKGGVRAPIGTGATGAVGPQGPVGLQGPAGATGPAGTITANTGGTINGPLVFTNNGSIVGGNIPFTGTLNGGNLVNTNLLNAKVSKLVSPNGSIDPVASTTNTGNVGIGIVNPTAKLEVAGTVKATNFVGDGSGLTGIAINNTTINNTIINGGTASLDKVILKPVAQTNLTNSTPIQATGSLIRIQGASGPVDYAPGATQISLTGVVDGQLIVLKGMSNTNSVTLDDGSGLDLNGGVKFIVGAGDTITFVYDALTGNWIEITRTDV